MKRLILLFTCVLMTVGGCGGGDSSTVDSNPSSPPVESTTSDIVGTLLLSTNGAAQIITPDDWSSMTTLNDTAIIQAANLTKEQYIIVSGENKAEPATVNLAEYSDITAQRIIDGLNSPNVSSPKSLTINGYDALQKEISGAKAIPGNTDTLNVVYFHTSIETPTHFYQILTWTLKSRLNQNRSVLQEVTNSFQEAG